MARYNCLTTTTFSKHRSEVIFIDSNRLLSSKEKTFVFWNKVAVQNLFAQWIFCTSFQPNGIFFSSFSLTKNRLDYNSAINFRTTGHRLNNVINFEDCLFVQQSWFELLFFVEIPLSTVDSMFAVSESYFFKLSEKLALNRFHLKE